MKTEIKLDPATLPKDGEWVEFETYEQSELIGQYFEDDALISHPDNDFTGIHSVYYWEPLEIKWDFKEWTERNEGLAIVEGFDRFGNEFKAGAEISLGDIIKVEDIEFVK